MVHAVSVLLSASLLAGVLLFIVETLIRERARIVHALRMTAPVERASQARVMRVRYAAGPRPALYPAMVPARARRHEAA